VSTEWRDEEWPAVWADDEHAAWLDKWAPKCPIGNPQRVRECQAYREREPGRLQLRVAVLPATEGVCDVIVEEDEDTVRVRVLLCYEDHDDREEEREYWNCPVHAYLESPLNGRTVIDVQTDRALPLFVPSWKEG
jgi:hypothetical protein